MSRTHEELTKAEKQKEQKEMEQKNQVEKRPEKQEVTFASTLAATPMSAEQKAECLAEIERVRQAARANTKAFLMGSALLFKKGEWFLGSDKIKVPDGTPYVALMSLASIGYLRWNEDKTASHRDVGKIAEGWKLPDKETLPDRDPEKWPIGLSGKKEDPWRECCYLPLVTPDGETIATFATNTPTGVNAFWRFIDRYSWQARQHPGEDPIIELEAGGYPDRRYGWVDTPGFRIVGWIGRSAAQKLIGGGDGGGDNNAGAAEAAPLLKDDMGDDIPF
jgi:hypothetical protein